MSAPGKPGYTFSLCFDNKPVLIGEPIVTGVTMKIFLYTILAFTLTLPSVANAQSWVYGAFSNGGSYYNANNHGIPSGAGGYGGTVYQSQPYAAPAPMPQPQPYRYNPIITPQGPAQVNPQTANPNNFYYQQPTTQYRSATTSPPSYAYPPRNQVTGVGTTTPTIIIRPPKK